ncbi:mechanosensitive ion channel family protein [Cellvibrio sp. pealriver]|uniref:mechanosensitive ion channel family protein n=1 Tax=Cellvibrio sp. pealriver TaxID=1622269 RepID=UPI000A658171|nr:mechanosensitive ion channel family protein [Cellvibrio sp. pealriver]
MAIEIHLRDLLTHFGLGNSEQAYVASIIVVIILTSLVIHWVLHRVVLNIVHASTIDSQQLWLRALYQRKLFTRLALTLQGIIIYTQARLWLDTDAGELPAIEVITHLWILLFGLLSFFSLLDTLEDVSAASESARRLPLRGLFQGVKLIGAIIALIFSIALLIGKSPLILFSGLGAMTAILLLVFKDPILGLVAGIQLSANRMLSLGDWLEMPKYGADGEVTDINLTTVKIRNWDKTITTVPTYALISDSFKNWRGMSESGGRRIKRAIHIDATSVKFLTEDDIKKLRKAHLLSEYIENKLTEITEYNSANNIDTSNPANGRRLTNLGTFRAYLTAYLKTNAHINLDMTHMVRQLSPGAEGIPLEIYAFSNNTQWLAYENIQSDIFDHIFAVLPEFDLRVYQSPTGYDMQQIGKTFTQTTTTIANNE